MEGEISHPARRVLPLASSYVLLLLVSGLDYATGREIHLGTLYLLAAAAASWNLRSRQLVFYVFATALLWSGAQYLSGVRYSQNWLVGWSVLNHLGAVTITAAMVSKTKATLDRQHRLIRDLGQTLLKVSQFKELVPVCRLCHELHLDDDYRARLEELVQEGADMESIGNVCPACLADRAARVTSIPVEAHFQTDASTAGRSAPEASR